MTDGTCGHEPMKCDEQDIDIDNDCHPPNSPEEGSTVTSDGDNMEASRHNRCMTHQV